MHAHQKAPGSIHAHTTDQAMHAPKGKAKGKKTSIYTQKPPKVADPQLSWSKLPWTGNLLEQSSLNANLIFWRCFQNHRERGAFTLQKQLWKHAGFVPLTHGSMANTSTTSASSRLRVYTNMYTRLQTQKAQNPPTEIKMSKNADKTNKRASPPTGVQKRFCTPSAEISADTIFQVYLY